MHRSIEESFQNWAYTYMGAWVIDKDPRAIQWRKDSNGAGTVRQPHVRKWTTTYTSYYI